MTSAQQRQAKRDLSNELEAVSKLDSREACTGLCMRTFKTSAGGPCKNQKRIPSNPNSCANCLRYSNYRA